ncbi:hypothetical protein OG539_40235 [Actinacidiphila glaucinigra]|uniref:hypothetical protein n=1 Tax=Actinacidiphila glaucinigra TaxID=235986 RepID=UPI00325023D2
MRALPATSRINPAEHAYDTASTVSGSTGVTPNRTALGEGHESDLPGVVREAGGEQGKSDQAHAVADAGDRHRSPHGVERAWQSIAAAGHGRAHG